MSPVKKTVWQTVFRANRCDSTDNKKDSNNLLEAKVRDVIYNGTYTRIIAVYRKQEIKINVEVDEIYNKGDIIYLDLDEDWVWLIGSNK